MRTELAPLIVVKQEFPDFRIDGRLASLSENGEENNNIFANIKSENDCNNNQSEDLNSPLFRVKKSKKKISFRFLLTHGCAVEDASLALAWCD